MKTYYIYMLLCSDNSIYIGITNNLNKRVSEHAFGIDKCSYTYSRRPIKLIFSQKYHDIKYVIGMEKQLKKWTRKKKLALANGDFELLRALAKSKKE